MDATSLYPGGHHPAQLDHKPNDIDPGTLLPRSGRGARYICIHFGCRAGSHTVLSSRRLQCGRDSTELSELSSTVSHDTFNIDLFARELHAKGFEQVSASMPQRRVRERNGQDRSNAVGPWKFLRALIKGMKQHQPDLWPTAYELLVPAAAMAMLSRCRECRSPLSYRGG
ncbi:hypothetical protein BV20DRAFT_783894 [Pilatotrama ljubarskyi]|nr:hypothetical protein BV20DRAFT_783894 [Pilatotrama ljubarskyi]